MSCQASKRIVANADAIRRYSFLLSAACEWCGARSVKQNFLMICRNDVRWQLLLWIFRFTSIYNLFISSNCIVHIHAVFLARNSTGSSETINKWHRVEGHMHVSLSGREFLDFLFFRFSCERLLAAMTEDASVEVVFFLFRLFLCTIDPMEDERETLH